jgi:hypothetical protein
MADPFLTRITRIQACRADLLTSGVDLADGRAGVFVRAHLDYFQLMLGDESTADEVVALIARAAGHGPFDRRPA